MKSTTLEEVFRFPPTFQRDQFVFFFVNWDLPHIKQPDDEIVGSGVLRHDLVVTLHKNRPTNPCEPTHYQQKPALFVDMANKVPCWGGRYNFHGSVGHVDP